MSISSSFRLLSPKFSQSLHPKYPIPKTLIPSSISSSSTNLSKFPLFSSISIERLPTKTSTSSSPPSITSVSQQPIEDLPPQLQEIIKLFQSVQESKAKYEQLLFYGKKLKPLEPQFKTSENKVQGCVSQVWVRAYFDSEKNVRFEADSDSVLTKGLAALLVQGLSGQPVSKILTVSPGFVTLLGLQQSLSPSRNNGFLNMLRLMQNKALQLYKEAEEGGNVVSEVENRSNSESRSEVVNEDSNTVVNSDMGTEDSSSGIAGNNVEIESNSVQQLGSRGERIKSLIEQELNPIEMEVEDISYQHAGHAGVRGSAGETHFNLRIVSNEFEGKSQVKRHRLIYNLLKEELESGLHALSIVAKTPSEAAR